MNLLPEYNEIIYHTKVCSELEFREYWSEIQSRLSVEVTDDNLHDEAEKYITEIQSSTIAYERNTSWDYSDVITAFIDGGKYVRDRNTQPQSDAIEFAEWVDKNGYRQKGKKGQWKRALTPYMTSEQLYELYKASK